MLTEWRRKRDKFGLDDVLGPRRRPRGEGQGPVTSGRKAESLHSADRTRSGAACGNDELSLR
jgi:hypothetical protein